MTLKSKLEYHYKFFNKKNISPDPVDFLHLYDNYYDIEISGIISSVFAFGNVTQINRILNQLHLLMNNRPYDFVMNFNYKSKKN